MRAALWLCASVAIAVCVSAVAAAQVRATAIRIGFARPGGGYAIETIPLETYVARVLAGESRGGSRPAAGAAPGSTQRTM